MRRTNSFIKIFNFIKKLKIDAKLKKFSKDYLRIDNFI